MAEKNIKTSKSIDDCVPMRWYCDQCQRQFKTEFQFKIHESVHRWLQSQQPFQHNADIHEVDQIDFSCHQTIGHSLVTTIYANDMQSDVMALITTSNSLPSQSIHSQLKGANKTNETNTADPGPLDRCDVIIIHSSTSKSESECEIVDLCSESN